MREREINVDIEGRKDEYETAKSERDEQRDDVEES